MDFCNNPGSATLPTELTVGDRTYDMLSFFGECETSVVGSTMVERAKEMLANLGEEDGQYLLDNQQDIPAALREKVAFVFTSWRDPDNSEGVYYVGWRGDRWIRYWGWIGRGWLNDDRVLRRKKSLVP